MSSLLRRLAAAAGACALLPALIAQAQDVREPQPVTVTPVAGDIYLLSGEGGNVAAYVTNDGVVLVDNMFDRNHEGIVAAVAAVTDQPIVYALNTHQHDDHAGGDAKLLPIADVIAHRNVRANLISLNQPYYQDDPALPIGLPNITFDDEFAVYVDGREVRAVHLGRGHTNGDVVVYFPAERVIHTGDLFLGRRGATPTDRPPGVNIYVDYAQGGSFVEWTATLDRVLELDFDTVIPGHGPVSTRADLVRFRNDLTAMRDRIQSLIRMGASRQQVLTVFEMDYGWRSTGCPPSPPTPGCLQFQQIDALIDELADR